MCRRLPPNHAHQFRRAPASLELPSYATESVIQGSYCLPDPKFASTTDFSPDAQWADGAVHKLIEGCAEAIQCTLVHALARSERLPELPGHIQRQFNVFFRRFLRAKEGHWRSVVSVREAGAAFERGGRFTDALGFYEAITKEANYPNGEKQFARTRLIVCKKRQLEHEREQGGRSRRATDIERELAEMMKRFGIERNANFPKYPELDP